MGEGQRLRDVPAQRLYSALGALRFVPSAALTPGTLADSVGAAALEVALVATAPMLLRTSTGP